MFYRAVMSDPARFILILYDPIVADACLAFGPIYRRARYVHHARDEGPAEVLRNWPEQDVRLICVSTGGRVLARPTMRCTPIRYISACVRRRILLPCRHRGHPRVWADLNPGPGRPFFALPPLWHTRAAAGAILHD